MNFLEYRKHLVIFLNNLDVWLSDEMGESWNLEQSNIKNGRYFGISKFMYLQIYTFDRFFVPTPNV